MLRWGNVGLRVATWYLGAQKCFIVSTMAVVACASKISTPLTSHMGVCPFQLDGMPTGGQGSFLHRSLAQGTFDLIHP